MHETITSTQQQTHWGGGGGGRPLNQPSYYGGNMNYGGGRYPQPRNGYQNDQGGEPLNAYDTHGGRGGGRGGRGRGDGVFSPRYNIEH